MRKHHLYKKYSNLGWGSHLLVCSYEWQHSWPRSFLPPSLAGANRIPILHLYQRGHRLIQWNPFWIHQIERHPSQAHIRCRKILSAILQRIHAALCRRTDLHSDLCKVVLTTGRNGVKNQGGRSRDPYEDCLCTLHGRTCKVLQSKDVVKITSLSIGWRKKSD